MAETNEDGLPIGVQLTHEQIMMSNAKASKAARTNKDSSGKEKPAPKPKPARPA